MITGKLSLSSTMKDVIEEYSIMDDLLVFDAANCKILIKKKNGSYFTFKYERFHSMTVNEFVSIKNVDDDFMIEVKTNTVFE